jgi:hypothetical protein
MMIFILFYLLACIIQFLYFTSLFFSIMLVLAPLLLITGHMDLNEVSFNNPDFIYYLISLVLLIPLYFLRRKMLQKYYSEKQKMMSRKNK